MAFLSGIIQYRGKLGQTIGRKNGNASVSTNVTRGQNVVGIAPETVNNPQTVKQAAQRLKMRPAASFYRELGYILNHSWQGKKYKAMSRNTFMQKALVSSDYVFPFLKKGDNRFVPATYPLSEGSLHGAQVLSIANSAARTTLKVGNTTPTTIAELSAAIVDNNAGILYGDKLTFVSVHYTGSSAADYAFTHVAQQLVLSETDARPLTAFAASDKITFTFIASQAGGGSLAFQVTGISGERTLCAAAVIQSRVPAGGSNQWQRSNAQLFLTDTVLNAFMTAGAYNEALASYQSSSEPYNSDWYLNYGTFATRGVTGGGSVSASLFNIASLQYPSGAWGDGGNYDRVAAISTGSEVYVIIGNVLDAATSQRNVYRMKTTSTIEVLVASAYAKEKIESGGYATITYDEAVVLYGITVETSQGGGGEQVEPDTP